MLPLVSPLPVAREEAREESSIASQSSNALDAFLDLSFLDFLAGIG